MDILGVSILVSRSHITDSGFVVGAAVLDEAEIALNEDSDAASPVLIPLSLLDETLDGRLDAGGLEFGESCHSGSSEIGTASTRSKPVLGVGSAVSNCWLLDLTSSRSWKYERAYQNTFKKKEKKPSERSSICHRVKWHVVRSAAPNGKRISPASSHPQKQHFKKKKKNSPSVLFQKKKK
jgi:hypothetical protein